MTRWIRFAHGDRSGFGALEGERIKARAGCMFNQDLRRAAQERNV
jgi:hypothetical protein